MPLNVTAEVWGQEAVRDVGEKRSRSRTPLLTLDWEGYCTQKGGGWEEEQLQLDVTYSITSSRIPVAGSKGEQREAKAMGSLYARKAA